eukprot:CAMPEP_0114597826 /NCGR_PEP_ID=MMETSP0125-20121206/20215_1 /TAXON_ID=485358 ORGANISM="Aristerostoma sp., Strain ATCC 50986" /NCGR_SAMPLE_ID=MMETSP0125 /ASSEMBLY_ACC=CAM_ASM_000245 /LENGTH=57 /DNA_ID=CAMNT_0001802983 /DNA_START=325 /DNA_END=498 /DNA_ORIENTATION=-
MEEAHTLREAAELSERVQTENDKLRHANDQFKIEYDRAMEELKESEINNLSKQLKLA